MRARASIRGFALLGALIACSGDRDPMPGNSVPTANAGPDQAVEATAIVTLDGSGSADSTGDPLTHAWTQLTGSAVSLSDPAAERPTFQSRRRLETLLFSLTVSNATATSPADTVAISIDRFPLATIAGNVAPANSDVSTPGKLAAINVGENALVISCRLLGVPAGLFGVFVDRDGAVIATIPIASHDCNFPRPSIASTGSGFLVVFQRNAQVVATRLAQAPAFTVLGETTISSTGSNWMPVVAAGGDGYLVAWASYRDADGYDIYGAPVAANGVSAGEQPVFEASGEQIEPAIAFGGTNFLVVWRDTRNGSGPAETTDIYGTRVEPNGTVLDPSGIAISTAANTQGDPHLAFDGTNYLAVWADARRYPAQSQPPLDIVGTRISPAGALLDGAADTGGMAICTADVGSGLLYYASAAYDGTNFLVPFAVFGFGPPAGIYLARVSPGGMLLDRPSSDLGPSISGPPPSVSRLIYPVAVGSNRRTILTWVNNTELGGEAKDIVGVVMDP